MQKIDSLSGDDGEYYTIVANVKCLKRNVRLVVWYPEGLARVKSGGYRLYYSTDKDMSGEDTMAIYHARFQEEYLFRDGKQFLRPAGLSGQKQKETALCLQRRARRNQYSKGGNGT